MNDSKHPYSLSIDCGDRAGYAKFAPPDFEDCSIVDRFDSIVRLFPARLAIQDMEASITYAELAASVDQIAAATIAVTQSREGPIALLLSKKAALPAAMLGVLKAGRTYVALDAGAPVEHNNSIVADANACAVISNGDFAAMARAFSLKMPIIDLGTLSKFARHSPILQPHPDDLAAIYYTSGSKGQPKGVVWNHRNILHWVKSFSDAAHISCSDRMLLAFSANAAASYRSIYCALLNGASVHMLSPLSLGVPALIEEIRSRGITIYHSVPTLLRRIAELVGTAERFDSVRVAYLAGDRVTWRDVDEARRCFSPDARLFSALSSTETGPCIHTFIDDSLKATTTHPPLGYPAPGWTVTIVDEGGVPVSDGESGDIVVKGRFIALGYWQGSELDVRAFPTDPEDAEARVFVSGDRGRRRADGLIEFVGRNDGLIKLSGHRIDPAEIESILTALDPVSDAVVVVRGNENGIPRSLVVYVLIRAGIRGLMPRHIQALLAQRLPRHMVPSLVYLVDQLPRLPSSKIDRRAIETMDDINRRENSHDASPLISEVTDILESVLGVTGATPDDTIASVGGDSLQELGVFFELECRFGIHFPTEMINERPAIRGIASWIAVQIEQASNFASS